MSLILSYKKTVMQNIIQIETEKNGLQAYRSMINNILKESIIEEIRNTYGSNPELEKLVIEFVENKTSLSSGEKRELIDKIFRITNESNS